MTGTPGSGRPHGIRSVLLTGVTGSLGSHTCAELLTHTAVTVHCLVRADTQAAARTRAVRRLARLDDPPPHTGARLTALPADVTRPRLGLSGPEFDALAENAEVIVHFAAHIDLTAPYDVLAPSNVGGVQQLIALARRRIQLTDRPPVVHHMSTAGALLDARRLGLSTVDEHTRANEQTSGSLGYPRSKAAAEVAWTRAATELGLPVAIHRPAFVTGHSRTGRTFTSDLFIPLLWAATALGAAPAGCPGVPAERVDVVARAFVRLLDQDAPVPGTARAHHLAHPRPLSLDALFDALRRAGHALEAVRPDEWWRRVTKHADDPGVAPLAALHGVGRYLVPVDDSHLPPGYDSSATWRTLGACGMEPIPFDDIFLDRLVTGLALPPPAA